MWACPCWSTSFSLDLMAYTGRGSYSTGSSESTSSSGESRVRAVCLHRRTSAKLGFSIRGGKEHGTGFFVTAVEPNSEAFKQGLMVGDQIIRINGFPVEDATHKEVLQLILGQSTVNFKVKSVGMIPVKENPEDELSWQIVEPSMTNGHQTDIFKGDVCDDSVIMRSVNDVKMVLRVPPRAKLGCGICKGPEWKPGVFIQFTKENSIARQAGLRPGDQILQCNNFVFTPDTPFNEAVSVMRCSGVLELIVRKGAGLELFPGESSGYNSSASSVAGDNPPRLAVLPEECNGASDAATNGSDRRLDQEVLKNGRMDYPNGCTVIHVGGDETDNKKIAEICMVSQQLETKTTTVFVEVHHSEDDTVSNTQSEPSTDRLTNSSSVSSFTSSASSLSSAISQELERRSKRSMGNESPAKTVRQTDKLIKNGLAKEKVEQHEQLMMEFKKAHRKMFSSDSDSTINNEEREESRLSDKNNHNGLMNGNGSTLQNGTKEIEKTKIKRQTAPPPPPPLPDEKTLEKQKPPTSKKHAPPPPPPSPPYCPTPDYDTASIASVGKRRGDIVEMQSLESFKLTNPSTVKPKPPSTYFSRGPPGSENSNGLSSNSSTSTIPLKEGSKPIVTIREYPGGRERKNPSKFDFLQNSSKGTSNQDEPITSRLQNELCQTLSRATTLTKNINECTSESVHGHQNGNGSVGTVVTINLSPHQKSDSNKPFYLFPNGNPLNGVDNKKLSSLITSAASKHTFTNGKSSSSVLDNPPKNSVTFNFSNKTQEVRNGHTQKNGILKNGTGNVSQVQIQSQNGIDKISPQKSIKFGGM
ncbi:whirlin isoform X2 [Halyomorpha halys]|uniref:whirlin isoform X2 n=1 Tax=Halyomorpha halys TaxID=286706 RepID=UPI0006D519C8|nr:whirlin isoform X2 [Halyomorpha halys]